MFQSNRWIILLSGLVLTLGFIACSGQQDTRNQENADVVVWEDLKNLNTLLHEAEAYVDGNHITELKALIPNLHTTAMAVAGNSAPDNVHHPDEVKVLQQDLLDIAKTLADISSMSDEELKATTETMHPITDKLFEVSGAPHTHDFGKPGEEDHDDHNHDDHDHEDHDHE